MPRKKKKKVRKRVSAKQAEADRSARGERASQSSLAERQKLTEGLDGRNDQVAGEDLTELGRASGLTGERLLQLADEDVAEGSRDDEAVERHLEGARVDLGTREHVGMEGRIFGRFPDGDAGQVRAEHLL